MKEQELEGQGETVTPSGPPTASGVNTTQQRIELP